MGKCVQVVLITILYVHLLSPIPIPIPIPIPHLLPVIQERKTVESSVNYTLGCHSSENWSWHHDVVCHVTIDSRCSFTFFFIVST